MTRKTNRHGEQLETLFVQIKTEMMASLDGMAMRLNLSRSALVREILRQAVTKAAKKDEAEKHEAE